MSVQFRIDGLAELRAALARLPDDLTGEAANLVEGAGNAAAVDVRTAYGSVSKSGNLASHVTVDRASRSRAAVAVIVRSTAKHAQIYEVGSQSRKTRTGAPRGSMPPAHVFVPTLIRARRRLEDRLAELLRREGLIVRESL